MNARQMIALAMVCTTALPTEVKAEQNRSAAVGEVDSKEKASRQANVRACEHMTCRRVSEAKEKANRQANVRACEHMTCRRVSDSQDKASLRLMLGFPWSGARVDLSHGGKWGAFAEFDMALANRLQPTLGLTRELRQGKRLRAWAELGLGHQYQDGTLSQQGPSAVALLGAELGAERIFGYGWLRSRHTLLLDRVTIRTGDDETLAEWDTTHLWSPGFALGMGRRVGQKKRWSWQGGIDWRFVDRGKIGFVLPGVHGMITVTL